MNDNIIKAATFVICIVIDVLLVIAAAFSVLSGRNFSAVVFALQLLLLMLPATILVMREILDDID